MLIEYSIHNAINAGFEEIIFVIRKEIEQLFKSIIKERCPDINAKYICQDETRPGKLYGTAHALFSCKDIIHNNFAIINADDYYGFKTMKIAKQFIDNPYADACSINYQIDRVLSDTGAVNRGVCKIRDNFVIDIKETKGIKHNADSITDSNNNTINPDEFVSMGIWAFTPGIFVRIEPYLNALLKKNSNDELPISTVIENEIVPSPDQWVGITYETDIDHAKQIICSNTSVYNKLVRDNIPDIIRNENKSVICSTLSQEEYINALNSKLHEEHNEYDKDSSPEELADMLEVIYAIAETKGYSEEQLNLLRDRKRQKNGAFKTKTYLKMVID